MNKKGQITLFIIIGIIIVVIAAVLYFISRQQPGEVAAELAKLPTRVQPVYLNVRECLKQVSVEGTKLIAIKGGYYLPKNAVYFGQGPVAYGSINGTNILATIPEMESQLGEYANAGLKNCINLDVFKQQGLQFEESANISTKVTISDYSVTFEVDYPLVVISGSSRTQLNKFTNEVALPLGNMYATAAAIAEKIAENPEYINPDILSNSSYTINIMPVSITDMVYSIKDEKDDFTFLFAANYGNLNKAPVMDINDSFELKKGQEFNYTINVSDPENDILTFYDDTPMFDITSQGLISFVPEVAGEFNVEIRVEDNHNNEDRRVILFKVNE
jgi:hypothetical protein